MVRAGTASVRFDPRPGHSQGLHPDDLVNQAEPHASFHPLFEGFQHAFCPNRTFHPVPFLRPDVSRLFSRTAHWHGFSFVRERHNSSTFLRPLAPPALPGFSATMGALTPVRPAYRRPCVGQVSLVHTARPSCIPSPTTKRAPPSLSSMPSQRDGLPGALTFASSAIQSASRSGLHTLPAGSSLRPAESCSSSYGLQVRLRLLSTLPHGSAVTFNYRERASPGRGLSPLRSHLLPGALAEPGLPPAHRTRVPRRRP